MDPKLKPHEVDDPFQAIWHEHSIGEEDWEHDYRAIARSKAEQAWREGTHNLVVQMLAPATLCPGDTFYDGSFNYYGAVVACSGIEPYFDMLISGWCAVAVQQLTRHYIQKHRAAYPDEEFMP